uniref:CCHC-type domain-containing protein n=1 Tax=Tanacetum cinerariifolium TaxID=118510 RepID=A0A699HSD3_TANCI|nr:hypothetical protein [Tanacetum cinerariifolium]
MPPKRNGMSATAIEQLIEQRIIEALATLGNNKNSGNPHNSDSNNIVGGERTARHYTYKDFLNCQPLNFKGTEGVVLLAHWFEKMESVFHISNCIIECQVKYATCTLLGSALTWWNTHKVHAYAVRQADNKRRMDNNLRDDHVQQPPYKRLDKEMAYTARPGEKKETLACFECGEQGHYRSECPELKNQNLENQDGSSEARKRVYAFGGGETNQDPRNIADDIDA